MDIVSWEIVFCRWAFRNGVIESNVELAVYSNVCQRWREALKRSILDEEDCRTSCLCSTTRKQRLLLPSMISMVLSDNISGTIANRNQINVDLHSPLQTFCVSWFPSEGIQDLAMHVVGSDDETLDADDVSLACNSATVHPFGVNVLSSVQNPTFVGELYEGSDDERRSRNSRSSRKQQSRKLGSPSSSRRTFKPIIATKPLKSNPDLLGVPDTRICTEWRGYRSAWDVLSHFGYCETFVNEVFNEAIASCKTGQGNIGLSSINPNVETYIDPTVAVRGATVARPERYCLCVEKFGHTSQSLSDELNRNFRNLLKNRDISMRNDSDYSSSEVDSESDGKVAIRIEENKHSLKRLHRHIQCLQRDIVPRALDMKNSASNPVRCVQFLNSSGSHAVCMITPPFVCMPIPEPVTIFCVGIATEDGCFMSGLRHRFEFGHLYPTDFVSKVTERSSICVATESWNSTSIVSKTQSMPHSTASSRFIGSRQTEIFSNGTYDEHSDEYSFYKRMSCDCIFRDCTDKADQSDEEQSRIVHRGRFGPGSWHCYTAVIDGNDTFIRVDGHIEPMTHKKEYYSECQEQQPGCAMLDGLTIGSDHCFGMSLCCGDGSGGEGEGAIAELAIFSGKLHERDLNEIEHRLMLKYGIRNNSTSSIKDAIHETSLIATLRKEDEWEKQAHALLVTNNAIEALLHSDDENNVSTVPLRFLARHRSVAWLHQDPVTGEEVRNSKIGCKNGTESSCEW